MSTAPDFSPDPGETPDDERHADRTPATRRRGRRWRRAAISLLTGLLVLAVGIVAYAGSEDALQRFYIPMASRILGVELEAEGLDLGWGPSVGLRRLRLVHVPTGASVSAEGVSTSWAMTSLYGGRTPRVTAVRIGRLSLSVPPLPEEVDAATPPRPETRTTPWIPISIGQAHIERVDVSVNDESSTWLSGTLGPLELSGLEPGRTARLGAPVDLRFAPSTSQREFRVAGPADLQLEQPEAGRTLRWRLDWPVQFAESNHGSGAAAPLAFAIEQSLRGALAADGASTHALEARARRAQDAAGSVIAELRVGPSPPPDSASPRRPLFLQASGEGLQPALVNPLLAATGPESLQSGELGGRVRLDLTGDVIDIDSELRGAQLRLAASADHGPTPPLDLQLVQQATFHRVQRVLELERSSLRVHDAGRLLIRADLTAPLRFEFEDHASTASVLSLPILPEGSAGAVSAAARSESGPPPARLEMDLDQIEIERLRPWTAVWGSTVLSSTESGVLSGELTAELAPPAKSVAVRGDLAVEGLMIRETGSEASRGPFTLALDFQGRSPDLSSLFLESVAAELGAADGVLARLEGRGTTDRERDMLLGRGTVTVPDLPLTLRQFGLLGSERHVTLVAGDVRLELETEKLDREAAAHLSGDVHFRELRVAAQGRELTRSAYASFSGRMPPRQGRMETIEVVLQATDEAGRPAGTLSAGGYWPLGFEGGASRPVSPEIAGRLGFKLRGMDLRPWLELFGYRADDPGAYPWPASGDVTLTVDPKGEVFTLEGEERIGPLTP